MNTRLAIAASLLTFTLLPPVAAADWPQFHGPRRDNRSDETGLLKKWPEGGPKLLRTISGIGHGFATVAIVGETIFTAGEIGPDTVITAMDLSGQVRWRAKNGPACKAKPPGARSTPTVVEGKLYHFNAVGDLICLAAETGKPIWTVSTRDTFGGRNIRWALSEAPLVDGDRVICTPGGQQIAMVALNRHTGETVWTCKGVGDKPSYTSAILVDHGGLRQIVTLMANWAIGVAAETGKLLWTYEHKVPYEANCVSPVHHEGLVVLAGTWGRGATGLKLKVDGEACSVEEIWRTKELDNEHGGIVRVDGHLYGQSDGNHKQRHWTCLDFMTGETKWSVDGIPGRTGTLTCADGMLVLLGDNRTVALAPASPEGLTFTGRFDLPEGGKGPTWAHPVIHGGRLYLRHGDFLYVYDVRASGGGN